MPRKDKKTELKSWISSLNGFALMVVFESYSFNAIVLADNERDAEEVAKKEYPGAKSYTLTGASNRVIV
jgi:hypothetical protein